MWLVPLKNDEVTTNDGVTFTVVSFSNYKPKGPCVYVNHTPSVPSDAIYFFDIVKINGKSVTYMAGPKIFRSLGPIPRKYQLPQPNDIITYKGPHGSSDMVVKSFKLHQKDALAKGLQVLGVDRETNEKVSLRLSQIKDLELSVGSALFSRDKFLALYKDYGGSK